MSDSPSRPRRRIASNLFVQLLVAIIGGIALGAFFPDIGQALQPVATGFISLIKVLIAPIVFVTAVLGIAKMSDVSALGRIGLKTIAYFTVVPGFVLVLGLVVGNVLRPGDGFDIDPATLSSGGAALEEATKGEELPGTTEFILGIIPSSALGAFTDGNLLQVLFLAVIAGVALAIHRKHAESRIIGLIEEASQLLFRVMGWIMRLAPIGAFAAMAFVIGQYGIESMKSFAFLILACYGAGFLLLLVFAVICRVVRGNPRPGRPSPCSQRRPHGHADSRRKHEDGFRRRPRLTKGGAVEPRRGASHGTARGTRAPAPRRRQRAARGVVTRTTPRTNGRRRRPTRKPGGRRRRRGAL
ncbi:cation:dicarboxylate symporter family transporter [Corynebacterium sp. 335C]